ncbi:hypothetical protein OC844_003855 [Tilletia horrida]|nr:hypothetical protein OC844_003855 [Tilletia horrida]
MASGNVLFSLLERQPVLCADGGFATHLEDGLGVTSLGDSPVWSASVLSESPELIQRTHRDFLEAGAQIIGTATYQACHAGFQACDIGKAQATELMRLSIDLADEARSAFLEARAAQGEGLRQAKPLIALSLGPYGAFLRGGAECDYGATTEDELVEFHRERLEVFTESAETWSKVDLIAWETLPRLDEARAILRAMDELAERYDGPARGSFARKPAYISFVFPGSGDALPFAGREGEAEARLGTERGLEPLVELFDVQDGQARRQRREWGLAGIGINCTKSQYLPALVSELSLRLSERIHREGPIRAALFLEPDGGLVYDGSTRTWSTPQGEAQAASVDKWQRELIHTLSYHHLSLHLLTMDATPDYYGILGVSPSATTEEIREAYKRQSLKCHPDRFPNASAEERQRHTTRFQALADAYYVLSDPSRRAEYDSVRRSQPSASSSFGDDPQASANFFRSFFSGGETHGAQPEPEGVFGGVFEELLRPEVHRVAPVWKWVGSASGASLGFIMGNIPGAIGGAVLGNRLGAIRDAKGKSVAEVFVNLSSSQKAEILKALAAKVLGSMGDRP